MMYLNNRKILTLNPAVIQSALSTRVAALENSTLKEIEVESLPVTDIDEKVIYKTSGQVINYLYARGVAYTDSTKSEIQDKYDMIAWDFEEQDETHYKFNFGFPLDDYDQLYILKSDFNDSGSDVVVYAYDGETYTDISTEANSYLQFYTEPPADFDQATITYNQTWLDQFDGPISTVVHRSIYLNNHWIDFDGITDTTIVQGLIDGRLNSVDLDYGDASHIDISHSIDGYYTISGTLTQAQYESINKNTLYRVNISLDTQTKKYITCSRVHIDSTNAYIIQGYYGNLFEGQGQVEVTILTDYSWSGKVWIESFKELDTTNSEAQDTNFSEKIIGAGRIKLHKISKTGSYNDLIMPSGGIPKADLASDVQTSLGKADTSVQQVTGKGLSTNDFTDTYKQKVDTNETAIATETTRAIGQENKALYFKGAYDTVSGNVVTRRTGYANKENCNMGYDSTTHVAFLSRPAITENGATQTINIDGYSKSTNTSWAGMSNMGYGQSNYQGTCYFSFKNTSFTEATAYEFLNKLEIQYELATSYTENIIENQSILPLDTNMANKIRQKVVDGLQLFDKSSYNLETGYNAFIVNIKGNGTYTISANQTLYDFSIANYENGDFTNVHINTTKNVTQYTFTISNYNPALKYYCLIRKVSSTYLSNVDDYDIMLVEGNHLYPYSDFNQKEHITNEQAELLKQEEEKSSNLFDKKVVRAGGFYNNEGTWVSNSSYTAYIISLKAGTYTWTTGTETYAGIILTNSSGAYISAVASLRMRDANTPTTFTLSSDGYIVLSINNGGVSTTMLNKGSQAQPYHDWCGEIVHGDNNIFYRSDHAYTVNQVVFYNGYLYVCIQASTGNLPTNTTYWQPLLV